MEQSPKKENIESLPLVDFTYDKQKDIACLLAMGRGSQFSPSPTKVYKQLTAQCGENPTPEQASLFVEKYLLENKIDIPAFIEKCKNESGELMDNFKKTAEQIFGVKIPEGTKAYLTVNSIYPYNIEKNFFYTAISNSVMVINVSIHELWHFYTWYKFGKIQEESGEENGKKYKDIKESLTVLLNSDFLNLLPEGQKDNGYPQHKELRERIGELWKQNPDIEFVWNTIWKETESES